MDVTTPDKHQIMDNKKICYVHGTTSALHTLLLKLVGMVKYAGKETVIKTI